MTTQSSGEIILKVTFRTTMKLADTKRYASFLPLTCPYLTITQTRRGVFQSDPILETLLSYYSSSGIKEDPPSEDPGPNDRPLGILALVTAAVSCRA